LCGLTANAFAKGHLYCDSSIKSDLISQQKDRWSEHEQRVDSFWQDPNSFDDMFCGADLNSAFDGLIGGVGLGGLNGLINKIISKQISKVCNSTLALAPVNAADALNRACNTAVKSAERSVTNTLNYYLDIITKYDPKFLEAIYKNPNFSECLLMQMVLQWAKAHPTYFVAP
jgi:hypothetical protein